MIDHSLIERIMEDQDLAHFFIQEKVKQKKTAKKSSPKKASGTKAPKVSDSERNSQEYDSCRCCARIWKADGGLGYDKIQCNSKNMVSVEEAKKHIMDLEHAPSEEVVDKYL